MRSSRNARVCGSPALFGLADGVAFLIGAGLGWGLLSEGASEIIEVGALVAIGLYLLVVAAGDAAHVQRGRCGWCRSR